MNSWTLHCMTLSAVFLKEGIGPLNIPQPGGGADLPPARATANIRTKSMGRNSISRYISRTKWLRHQKWVIKCRFLRELNWPGARAGLPSPPPPSTSHSSLSPNPSPTSGLQLWGGERVQCATKNTSASQRLSEQLAMWTSMSVLWTLWFLLMWASMINLMPYAMIVLVL